MVSDPSVTGGWAAEQLTAYLSALTSVEVSDISREAIERVAEAFDAEVAALVVAGATVSVTGFPRGSAPENQLLELARQRPTETTLPGLGCCQVLVVPFDDGPEDRLLVARAGSGAFTLDERNLLRGMSRVLSLSLREKKALAEERQLRQRSERQAADNAALLGALRERQVLLERLTRIQRSITSRAPLSDVLDAIVAGARELIGETIVALWRIDAADPTTAHLAGSAGLDAGSALGVRLTVNEGLAGRAITEGRLVLTDDYSRHPSALPLMAELGVQTGMAAPVREDGEVIGSLAAASTQPGRRFSAAEQEVLLSFADLASLAMTDARMVQTLRTALRDARHDAMHDALTGLANRSLLRDRLARAGARAGRRQSRLALLFLDLDGFKHVNDSRGHDIGDKLLIAVSARLGFALRDADTVARLGGDEFAILIEDVTTVDEVDEVATRILELLAQPISVDGRAITVSASIGIALSDGDLTDINALLRNADLAMYAAKREGGGRFVHYETDMHRQTVDRVNLEQALRHAITNDELLLHYQPIHDLASGRIVAVEALCRWPHPTRGMISPGEFVPVAESTRLIGPLGEWVLRQACRTAAGWPDQIHIAVNLSALQIDRCLVTTVCSVLAETGLPPERLTLEVTESVAMTDAPETLTVIEELRAAGIHFAIDDFGTGYSSLTRLRQLPVDQIKIDRSFIADSAQPGGPALISAIIALARGADLLTVAEGVETDQQLQELRRLGCDHAQGFLLARPAAADTVTRLLAAQSARQEAPSPLPLPLGRTESD